MYKLDLPVDYKEAAAIERRRLMEEQRKSRIFNAKVRTIGVSNLIFFQTSKVKWLIAGLQCNYNAPTPFHNKKESLTYKDHGILQTQHTLAYPLFVSSWNEGKRGGGISHFLNFWTTTGTVHTEYDHFWRGHSHSTRVSDIFFCFNISCINFLLSIIFPITELVCKLLKCSR